MHILIIKNCIGKYIQQKGKSRRVPFQNLFCSRKRDGQPIFGQLDNHNHPYDSSQVAVGWFRTNNQKGQNEIKAKKSRGMALKRGEQETSSALR